MTAAVGFAILGAMALLWILSLGAIVRPYRPAPLMLAVLAAALFTWQAVDFRRAQVESRRRAAALASNPDPRAPKSVADLEKDASAYQALFWIVAAAGVVPLVGIGSQLTQRSRARRGVR